MPNCPVCNTPGAYVGATQVECPNRKCKCYSAKQALNNLGIRIKLGEGEFPPAAELISTINSALEDLPLLCTSSSKICVPERALRDTVVVTVAQDPEDPNLYHYSFDEG